MFNIRIFNNIPTQMFAHAYDILKGMLQISLCPFTIFLSCCPFHLYFFFFLFYIVLFLNFAKQL